MRPIRLLVPCFCPAVVLFACANPGAPYTPCGSNDDCGSGYTCSDGRCLLAASGGGEGGNAGSGGAAGSGGSGGGGGGDVTGPTIVIDQPESTEVYKDTVTIRARIQDDSGVDASRLTTTVADQYAVTLTNTVGSTYEGTFDTDLLPRSALYVLVKIFAYDLLGNESVHGFQFAVDWTGPLVSLEAPTVVTYRPIEDAGTGGSGGASGDECSLPFNPLGDSAVQHGDIIDKDASFGTVFFPRAFVMDRSNAGAAKPSGVAIAWINPRSVKLYILDAEGRSANQANHYLVHGDGDDPNTPGIIETEAPCDQVDPDGLAQVVDLDPAIYRGEPDYRAGGARAGLCSDGKAEEAPAVCGVFEATGITYWLTYGRRVNPENEVDYFYGEPAIYLADHDPLWSYRCTGKPFDIINMADGPACVAVVAEDNLGNRAVSQPIAICTDKDGVGNECDTWMPEAVREACIGACTPVTPLDVYPFEPWIYKQTTAPEPKDSCTYYCDTRAPDGCYCDSACLIQGDCCSDKFSVCGL